MSTVTQADRERAADHWIASHPDDAGAAEIAGFILSGKYDDWTSPQAFAAHRTSSQVELLEALTPSADTKAAYIGEVKDRICVLDEDGDEIWDDHVISWDATKAIMKMILDRAISNARSNSMVSGRVGE
jgi:hypothetical protein